MTLSRDGFLRRVLSTTLLISSLSLAVNSEVQAEDESAPLDTREARTVLYLEGTTIIFGSGGEFRTFTHALFFGQRWCRYFKGDQSFWGKWQCLWSTRAGALFVWRREWLVRGSCGSLLLRSFFPRSKGRPAILFGLPLSAGWWWFHVSLRRGLRAFICRGALAELWSGVLNKVQWPFAKCRVAASSNIQLLDKIVREHLPYCARWPWFRIALPRGGSHAGVVGAVSQRKLPGSQGCHLRKIEIRTKY